MSVRSPGELTPQEIAALVAKLQKYPYLCFVGEDDMGPLDDPPDVSPDVETKDVKFYETGAEVQASFLTKNNVELTIKSRNVAKVLELKSAFAKGDDVLASANAKTVVLVPLCADTGAVTITFPNAFLTPGLGLDLKEDSDPNSGELKFTCRPDAATGKPFTYATVS